MSQPEPFPASVPPVMPAAPPPLPVQPVAALDYANPRAQLGQAIVARSGSLLIASDRADCGPACVKCGEPGTTPYTTKYTWCPSWYYLFLPLALLIVAIIIAIVSKRGTISYVLCRQHHARRVKLMLVSGALSLAIPVAIAAALFYCSTLPNQNSVSGTITAVTICLCLALLFAAFFTGSAARPLRAVRIEDKPIKLLRLKGAAPGFLDALPPILLA